MPMTNTHKDMDNQSTNRSLQSAPTSVRSATEDPRTVRGAEAQATHVDRLVRARTWSKTRAPPVPLVTREVQDEPPSGRPESPDRTASEDPQERMELPGGAEGTPGGPTRAALRVEM